ncbi:MAG TPA: nuclear transport factor 2 family protein [Burkholderiales bacterium]|nr:nuclear transport factor 2 family protein [Burkholderiales bacterium]
MQTSIETPRAVTQWHAVLNSGDVSSLEDLLAENAVFHSPVVHTPQRGKALVTLYLSAARRCCCRQTSATCAR